MSGQEVREAVRAGGLLAQDRPVLVMLSGGRDSVCLLDVAVALCEPGDVSALHVNYGLRAESGADELHCAALCERLSVPLQVVRESRSEHELPAAPGAVGNAVGNLHAWAREVRYRAARRAALQNDALIATGHTASDQVETILYRLAASPGRRALLGMVASDQSAIAGSSGEGGGRLIRPLLEVTREQTAAYCEARGLAWREDEANDSERYARARVRHGLVGALRAVHPAAEANVRKTASLLREETELLDGLVDDELAGRRSITIARLAALPAALARLVLVRLAEDAAGTYVPQAGGRVQEILTLAARGGRAELHVGSGAGAVIEGGVLEMVKLPPRAEKPPPPAERLSPGGEKLPSRAQGLPPREG